MTAGQRNCYIAIDECTDKYSLDDVLFALREHVLLKYAPVVASTERTICVDVARQLDQLSLRMQRFQKKS